MGHPGVDAGSSSQGSELHEVVAFLGSWIPASMQE